MYQDMANLLFTNVIDSGTSEGKKYEEPMSLSYFEEIARTVMDEYDKIHKSKLSIVLFK